MKLALDARKIDDFGIGTYIQGLLEALPAVGQPEELVAYLPPGRAPAALAVVAVLDDLAHDQVGVVVALLGARLELRRRMQQPADPRRCERAEQSELERPRRVPGKLEARVQVDDALVVGERVKAPDLTQVSGFAHTAEDKSDRTIKLVAEEGSHF